LRQTELPLFVEINTQICRSRPIEEASPSFCVCDGDGRSILRQPFRDCRADTPRAAGNQRNLIC